MINDKKVKEAHGRSRKVMKGHRMSIIPSSPDHTPTATIFNDLPFLSCTGLGLWSRTWNWA